MRHTKNSLRQQTLLVAGVVVLLGLYWVIHRAWGLAIPCFWHEITGLYCPGCGVTRMFDALLMGDLYQVFRYNPFCFLLLPAMLVLLINYCYAQYKGQESWASRIPEWVWVVLIIVAIAYGVLRNLPCGSFLAPTEVR